MYQEVECTCEPVAADVWIAHNCDLHGNHAEEYAPAECSACGETESAKLEMFECTGCDEIFCVSHRIMFDGEEACPDCALFWAEDGKKKMHRAMETAMERRLERRARRAA